MVHEIAHVTERHSVQMILRDSGMMLFLSVVIGDISTVTSMSAALPALLVENSYSRQFETEADLVAGQWLLEKYGTTEPLQEILLLMESEMAGVTVSELLSTHPEFENRVNELRKLALEFTEKEPKEN